MLHLIYGNDIITVRQKAHEFISVQEKKGVKMERIEVENYSEGIFADIVGATSLFGEKILYVIDTPSGKTEIYDDVMTHLEALASSENTFLIIEEALLASQKKKFQKYTQNIDEYKKKADERFNPFGMADCLIRKDKKNLWLQFQQAKQAGLTAEEIVGTLWWQLKSLRLAKLTQSAPESGMKNFTYNKSKQALRTFKEGEIESLSKSLLAVYHDGHLGKVDINIALEHWILTI